MGNWSIKEGYESLRESERKERERENLWREKFMYLLLSNFLSTNLNWERMKERKSFEKRGESFKI